MTSPTRPQFPAEDSQFAAREAVNEAVQNLQEADFAKLSMIARYFVRSRYLQSALVDPDDLLHDAIVKTLDGRRRWKRGVSIIKHLDRVMESDSGHVAEQRASHGTVQLSETEAEPAALEPSPEARLQDRETLDAVTALFADDSVALQLIRLKSDGISASEIRCRLGMSKKQYATVTKRIRRRLAAYQAEEGN